jgi:hypothetical protein
MRTILVFLLISYTTILFPQIQNKTINTEIEFGHAPDCYGSQGICTFKTLSNSKSTSNTQVSFNKDSKELTLVLSNTTLDQTNKDKLLNNELEKDFYLYTFYEDFILSNELKETLNITKLTRIKKGNYLVKIVKDKIIMKMKLE